MRNARHPFARQFSFCDCKHGGGATYLQLLNAASNLPAALESVFPQDVPSEPDRNEQKLIQSDLTISNQAMRQNHSHQFYRRLSMALRQQ